MAGNEQLNAKRYSEIRETFGRYPLGNAGLEPINVYEEKIGELQKKELSSLLEIAEGALGHPPVTIPDEDGLKYDAHIAQARQAIINVLARK